MSTVKITKEVLERALQRQLTNVTVQQGIDAGKGPDLVQSTLTDLHQMVVGTPVMMASLLELALRGLHATPDDVKVTIVEIDGDHGQKLAVRLHDQLIGHFRYDADGQSPEESGLTVNVQLHLSKEAVLGIYRLAAMGPFSQLQLPPPKADALVS